MTDPPTTDSAALIRTPDQRLRVFISSTLNEMRLEREQAWQAGARPHPPHDLSRAYLGQSHIFIGLYGDEYGWVAPGMDVSGLEDGRSGIAVQTRPAARVGCIGPGLLPEAKDPPEAAGPGFQRERCGHGEAAAGRVRRSSWPEPQRGWHPARSRRRRYPWQKPLSAARRRPSPSPFGERPCLPAPR